jgi:hypothetical protein
MGASKFHVGQKVVVVKGCGQSLKVGTLREVALVVHSADSIHGKDQAGIVLVPREPYISPSLWNRNRFEPFEEQSTRVDVQEFDADEIAEAAV